MFILIQKKILRSFGLFTFVYGGYGCFLVLSFSNYKSCLI